jgi:DNA-binding IclR family transcriptional regulator
VETDTCPFAIPHIVNLAFHVMEERPTHRNTSSEPDPAPLISWPAQRTIGRAVNVIDALIAADDPLGVSEIARRTALPKSTVARILSDLVETGMAARAEGGYGPGPRLLTMADRMEPPDASRLRLLLMPSLVRLRDETALDAAFGMLRYGRVRLQMILYGPALPGVLAALPLWAPAHATCMGKVMLAYTPLSDAEAAPLDRYTDRTITDPRLLSDELTRIRQEGVAFDSGEYIKGIQGLAAPVFGRHLRLVGALAVCGPRSIDNSRVRSALRDATRTAGAAIRAVIK